MQLPLYPYNMFEIHWR